MLIIQVHSDWLLEGAGAIVKTMSAIDDHGEVWTYRMFPDRWFWGGTRYLLTLYPGCELPEGTYTILGEFHDS